MMNLNNNLYYNNKRAVCLSSPPLCICRPLLQSIRLSWTPLRPLSPAQSVSTPLTDWWHSRNSGNVSVLLCPSPSVWSKSIHISLLSFTATQHRRVFTASSGKQWLFSNIFFSKFTKTNNNKLAADDIFRFSLLFTYHQFFQELWDPIYII